MPFGVKYAHTVVLNRKVYIGGGIASCGRNEYVVMEYDPDNGGCSLQESATCYFGMASVNDKLVLAGGDGDSTEIQVWNRCWMIDHYPKMPTGRGNPAAVGYRNYFIVACGGNCTDKVEILDCSTHQWYSAQSVPVGGRYMTSAVVNEYVFISAYLWKDGMSHVLSAHLPTLIANATSSATTDQIWQELPSLPVKAPTLLALQNHLLLVGGWGKRKELYSYDPEGKKWSECGELPVGMSATSCAVLPSGELFIAGGLVDDVVENSQQVWIGTLQ